MHFAKIMVSTTAALLLFTSTGYASGSITCQGPDVSISWGVSHISGAPMYGNPVKVTLDGAETVIPKSQVVGYYAHDDVILLLALDEHMEEVTVDLRYSKTTAKPATLIFKETAYPMRDCLEE